MIRNILFGTAIFIALGAPALAQDACPAPKEPAIPDGTKATPAQISAAQNDIKGYASATDAFQACLVREIARQKDLAKQSNTEFDPAIQGALEAKGSAQKKDVERVAAAWGAAVQAFTTAQGRKQRQNAQSPSGPNPSSNYGGGYRY